MSYILALDIGTSSVRAAVYDEQGRRIPKTFVKNERQLRTTEDGGAEIDADLALKQVVSAIRDVCRKSPGAVAQVGVVATSCFWHSLVGVDETGKALTPVYGWADTRSAKYVDELKRTFNERTVHLRTGCRFHPSYWTSKLLWLKNEKPAIFKAARCWLQFSDYLTLKLCGEALTSVSMASGTGLFDIRNFKWDAKLAAFIGIDPEKLPAIEPEQKFLGSLVPKYSKLFPELANAKWLLAIGDGAANNVGAGCVTKSRAALMIGTSGAMRVVYEGEPPAKLPPGLFCYRVDRKRVVIGGALSDGGGLYRWLKESLRLTGTDDEIEKKIALSAPDGHGLTFLPFLAGERSTGWNAGAHGAILGLRSSTDAIEITQAALESIAYRFAEIHDQLNEVFAIRDITASGGALRESPVWTQIIADILGKKLTLPDAREASSQGVVNLALEVICKKRFAEKKLKHLVFTPDIKRNKIYRKARERHAEIYSRLIMGDRK
jgi:gluconokinase